MADDKNAREKQARDADNRQRERDVAAARERGDEAEPPVETDTLQGVEELDALDFPATGEDVVAAVGDHELAAGGGEYTVEELVSGTAVETFETPDEVRLRVQRPTVAKSMKRIADATGAVGGVSLEQSQRTTYEKTLRALAAIDADDDDEGIAAVTDWVIEQVHEKERLPGSRAVRRRAAKFCRANGYEVGNDQWLGV